MADVNDRVAARGASRVAVKRGVGRDVQRATRSQAAKARAASKTSNELTLHDRLAHLTPQQATTLLGEYGAKLLARGAQREIQLKDDVYLGGDLFRVTFPGTNRRRPEAIVTVTAMTTARDRLHWNCTACSAPCEHVGAAFSFLLDMAERAALMTLDPETCFIADHDLNYPAMLVRLATVRPKALRERLEESWRRGVPAKLVLEYDDKG